MALLVVQFVEVKGANCSLSLLEKRLSFVQEHYFEPISQDDQLPMPPWGDQGQSRMSAPCQTFTRQFVHSSAHAEIFESDRARQLEE